jgi:hypothetical protein
MNRLTVPGRDTMMEQDFHQALDGLHMAGVVEEGNGKSV